MSIPDTIDLYFSNEIYQSIVNDSELFEFFKKNSTVDININLFFNTLIKEFYEPYKNEQSNFINKISDMLSEYIMDKIDLKYISQFIVRNFMFCDGNQSRTKKIKRYCFKPRKKDEVFDLIMDIDSNPAGEKRSEFISKMLIYYFKKPLFERERILFKSTYDKLIMCCKNPEFISFTYSPDNERYTVIPYGIIVSKEQMFNYLFCYSYDENRIIRYYTYRLNRIKAVSNSGQKIKHPNEIKESFLLTQKLGASYPINTQVEESCVLLSAKGTYSFKHIYFGRPQVDHKEQTPEGNFRYYFRCSTEQLYRYFRRFNPGEAIVEYPLSLRNRIMDFHRKSLESYESGNL